MRRFSDGRDQSPDGVARLSAADRFVAGAAGVAWLARTAVTLACALFERTGALMVKNAAETNRKV
jgi:hypothetical protein